MVQVLWLGGIALAALTTAIWPGWPFALLRRLRRATGDQPSTEAGADSNRGEWRTWPVRFVAATALIVVLTIAVDALWPTEDAAKPIAGATALLGLLIALALWCLWMLVDHRDAAARTIAESVDEPVDKSVDEDGFPTAARTEPGFLFDVVAVLATALAVAISGGVLYNIHNPPPPPEAAFTPSPRPDAADHVMSVFNSLHPQYEHLDAVPEGALVINPWGYASVDAEAELPHIVWHQANVLFGGDSARYLDTADVVVNTAGQSCAALGVIVVETDTVVQIGLVVEAPEPTPTPTPTPDATQIPTPTPTPTPTTIAAAGMTCRHGNLVLRDWFPIDLAAPLGDRDLQTLDGRGVPLDDD